MQNIGKYLFILLMVASSTPYSASKFEDGEQDWLFPYPRYHQDIKRTHRYVRSCQPIKHGNVTHEIYRSFDIDFNDYVETKYFTHSYLDDTRGKQTVFGHMSFVSKPLGTFSVLEPDHAGSCNPWFAPRDTVAATGLGGHCIVASNAGYFQPSSGACIGNIFSNGKLVQTSRGIQNANFGIKRDGSIVTGYLSEDDVLDTVNPFMQLVSGVGWLLRNGEVYTNESRKAECADSQTTGSINHFFDVQSARTAVGHDMFGRVVIAHVDGKTGQRGINLATFAQLLKKFGVVNAINLDGGGSTTFTINGSVVNYPSDECGRGIVCARKVSTILCVHEPECVHLSNCSGHGHCIKGACHCDPGWFGSSCNLTLLEDTGTKSVLVSESFVKSEDRIELSFIWSVSLAALFGVSLIVNVCLLNLYIATSWRERSMLRRKDDLQRLLEAENEDL